MHQESRAQIQQTREQQLAAAAAAVAVPPSPIQPPTPPPEQHPFFVEPASSSSGAAPAAESEEDEPASEWDFVQILKKKITGFVAKDEWEQDLDRLKFDAQRMLKMPKFEKDEGRKALAENLIFETDQEKAKTDVKPEKKFNNIIKSDTLKKFVLAFYKKIHLKKIPGIVEQVSQMGKAGVETVEQQQPQGPFSGIVGGSSSSGSATKRAQSARPRSGKAGGGVNK